MADHHVAAWNEGDYVNNCEGKVKRMIQSWSSLYTRNGETLLPKTENLFRETARLILNAYWFRVKPNLKTQLTLALHNCIQSVARNCRESISLIHALSELAVSPWDNPALITILRSECNTFQDFAIHEYYCKSVNPHVLWLRLQVLEETHNEDLALKLCNCCLRCSWMKNERKLRDMQLRLLFRLGNIEEMIQRIYTYTIEDGMELIARTRQTSKELCACLVELFLVRDLISSSIYTYTHELMVMWVDFLFEKEFDKRHIWQQTLKLASMFTTSAHYYLMVDIIYGKYGNLLLRLYVELYIKALTVDLNYLENARTSLPPNKVSEVETHFADILRKLSAILGQHSLLARECLLSAFSIDPSETRLKELESFSDTPISDSTPEPNPTKRQKFLEPCSGACHCEEKGACRRDLPPNILSVGLRVDKVVPTEPKRETANEKKTDDDDEKEVKSVISAIVNSVSRQTRLLTTAEMISSFMENWDSHITRDDDTIYTVSSYVLDTVHEDLPRDILQDLSIVLDEPRNKTLSWELGWQELRQRCKNYLNTKSAMKTMMDSLNTDASSSHVPVVVKEEVKEEKIEPLQVPEVKPAFYLGSETCTGFLKEALTSKSLIKLVRVSNIDIESVKPPFLEEKDKWKASPDLSVSAKTKDVITKAGLTMKQLNPTVVISHSDIVDAEKMLSEDKVDQFNADSVDEKESGNLIRNTTPVVTNLNAKDNTITVYAVGSTHAETNVTQVSARKPVGQCTISQSSITPAIAHIVLKPIESRVSRPSNVSDAGARNIIDVTPIMSGVKTIAIPRRLSANVSSKCVDKVNQHRKVFVPVTAQNTSFCDYRSLLPKTVGDSVVITAPVPASNRPSNVIPTKTKLCKTIDATKIPSVATPSQECVPLSDDLVRNLCESTAVDTNVRVETAVTITPDPSLNGKRVDNLPIGEAIDDTAVAQLLKDVDDDDELPSETVTLYSATGTASSNFEPSSSGFEETYKMFLISNHAAKLVKPNDQRPREKKKAAEVDTEEMTVLSKRPAPVNELVGQTAPAEFTNSSQQQNQQNLNCLPTPTIEPVNAVKIPTTQSLKLVTVNSVLLPPTISSKFESVNAKKVGETDANSADRKNKILFARNDRPKWVGVRNQHGGMEYRKAKDDSDKSCASAAKKESRGKEKPARRNSSTLPVTLTTSPWAISCGDKPFVPTNGLGSKAVAPPTLNFADYRQQHQNPSSCKPQTAVTEIIQRIDYAPLSPQRSANEIAPTSFNLSAVKLEPLDESSTDGATPHSHPLKKRCLTNKQTSSNKKAKIPPTNQISCSLCTTQLSSPYSLKRHLKAVHKFNEAELSNLLPRKEECSPRNDDSVFVPRRCSAPPKENNLVAIQTTTSVVDFESNFSLFADPDVGENAYVVGDAALCNQNSSPLGNGNSNNNNNRTILERFSYITKDNNASRDPKKASTGGGHFVNNLQSSHPIVDDDEDSLSCEGSRKKARSCRSHAKSAKKCSCCDASLKKSRMDTTRALRQVRMSSLKATGIQEFRRTRSCHRR